MSESPLPSIAITGAGISGLAYARALVAKQVGESPATDTQRQRPHE